MAFWPLIFDGKFLLSYTRNVEHALLETRGLKMLQYFNHNSSIYSTQGDLRTIKKLNDAIANEKQRLFKVKY